MEKIHMNSWERREIYEFFSAISQPFYSVTFNVDVTELYDYVKREGLSFYYALTWLVTKAINSVDAFGYAVENGEVVRLGKRDPSFTDMKKGSETFHIVTMPMTDGLHAFCADAKRRSEEQKSFIDMDSESAGLIFISCLPWLELTSLTNERDFDADDCVPRLSWGKYVPRDGRLILGMSAEVNHRFIDGVHIGQFAQALEAEIKAL